MKQIIWFITIPPVCAWQTVVWMYEAFKGDDLSEEDKVIKQLKKELRRNGG